MNIQFGATFNLAHSLNQMLYFRPRNKFEETEQLLPRRRRHASRQRSADDFTKSGRIAANLIARRHGVKFVSKHPGLTAMNWIQFGRLIHSIYGAAGSCRTSTGFRTSACLR